MSQTKQYTAQDIERYHSGQMSAAEMHALEKAALDDPFLADALEGYQLTSTPASDLRTLQERLQRRIEKDRKKRIFYLGNNWMKVAAMLVLLAGAGWFVFQTFSNKNAELATNQEVHKQAQAPSAAPESQADSAVFAPTAPSQDLTVKLEEKSTSTVTNTQTDAEVPQTKGIQTLKTNEGRTEQDREKEKVADDLMVSTLRNENVNEGFPKDNVTAKSEQADKKSRPDTIKNFDIVLQRSEVAPDEIVSLNNRARSAPRRVNIVVDSLEPAEGWTSFDNYIANNIKTPDELKTKPLSGEVELLFDINKEGKPENITVVKSLCEKCDEEAIRLLKEGPKWKNKKKKGKIKIRF